MWRRLNKLHYIFLKNSWLKKLYFSDVLSLLFEVAQLQMSTKQFQEIRQKKFLELTCLLVWLDWTCFGLFRLVSTRLVSGRKIVVGVSIQYSGIFFQSFFESLKTPGSMSIWNRHSSIKEPETRYKKYLKNHLFSQNQLQLQSFSVLSIKFGIGLHSQSPLRVPYGYKVQLKTMP